MEDLKSLITRIQFGDLEAYGTIVQRFQDMAVGYAYSILDDFHLAEDAAQEAFIQAYRDLHMLREPKAFPSWLKKIILKHCDRFTRGMRLETIPLEAVVKIPSEAKSPAEIIEEQEMKDTVLAAIKALPKKEREVTTLFYINGYSQKEIADFLEVPVTTVDNRLRTSRKRLKERMLTMVKDTLRKQAPSRDNEFVRKVGFITTNLELLSLLEDAKRIALEDSPVLIVGGNGTGKWLLAKGIHQFSQRRYGPILAMLVEAPEEYLESKQLGQKIFFVINRSKNELHEYLESKLFGQAQPEEAGLIVHANGGTLFLDQVDRFSLPLQDKLYHFIKNGEFIPVNGTEALRAYVRIIAATNHDLAIDVAEGRFHKDLYALLRATSIVISPLRQRVEDIPVLTAHYLEQLCKKQNRSVPKVAPETMNLLMAYTWTENARQLASVIEQALSVCDSDTLLPKHLPDEITRRERS